MITIFDRFKNITNVDIKKYFEDFQNFIDFDYNNIVNYFIKGSELSGNVIEALDSLYESSINIRNTWNNFTDTLSITQDFWELLDLFEETTTKIDTIYNSQKWFRSNKGLNFDNETEKDFILRQGQTLVGLADELGYSNPNDDWVNIALRNDLEEEDYSNEGGTKLKVVFQNNSNYKLNSVIDSISGEKVYGKDVQRKLEYDISEQDLTVLSYKETILQTYNILINTVKGSVPEFPDDGIDKALVGSNVNALQYPVLFRQISNLFSKDDTFVNFSIDNVYRDIDNVYIEISATSRIGEVLQEQLTLV